MPNRVIKEGICRSKSLAKCSLKAQDQFYKFLLFADDWGCFKVDYKKMKDDLFPYRKDIGIGRIESFLGEYREHGMLFFWDNKDKVYGFFVNWDEQTGEYLSRRGKRKTPEPPKKDVEKYNTYFNSLQVTSNGFKLLHNRSSDSGIERNRIEKKRKESESESEKKGKEKNKDPFVELFNSTCPSLPQVQSLSKGRKAKIRLRLQEHPSMEWWREVFERADGVLIEGKGGRRDWRPSFDWLIENDRNAVKVHEGNYEGGKSGTHKKTDPSSPERFTKTGYSEIPEPKT